MRNAYFEPDPANYYKARVVTYRLAWEPVNVALCERHTTNRRHIWQSLGPVSEGLKSGFCDECRARYNKGEKRYET